MACATSPTSPVSEASIRSTPTSSRCAKGDSRMRQQSPIRSRATVASVSRESSICEPTRVSSTTTHRAANNPATRSDEAPGF